jgi:hypothetical protein
MIIHFSYQLSDRRVGSISCKGGIGLFCILMYIGMLLSKNHRPGSLTFVHIKTQINDESGCRNNCFIGLIGCMSLICLN